MRLVDIAQETVLAHIAPGDTVIDATAGNGYDTAFLAQAVTATGRVFAFDIQPQAINNCEQLLHEKQLSKQVKLCLTGHENLLSELKSNNHRTIKTAMFNLGYLPNSDQKITTSPDHTLSALKQAWSIIEDGGIISVISYRGHQGGKNEYQQVVQFFQPFAPQYLDIIETPGPVLFLLRKP